MSVPEHKPLILVVDDDPGLLRLVSRSLELEGYKAVTAADGETALQHIEDKAPALVLLDIMMPGLDGFQVCQRIREFSEVPIIMLTAKKLDADKVQALNIGADDYITKPFSADELLARIKAKLRRAQFPELMPQPVFTCGELSIDFSQHRVTLAGEEAMLSPTEYKLLCLLALNAGRVLTQNDLLTRVWGWEYQGETHILQVAIARLRQKIGGDPSDPKYILTRAGVGYTFKKPQ